MHNGEEEDIFGELMTNIKVLEEDFRQSFRYNNWGLDFDYSYWPIRDCTGIPPSRKKKRNRVPLAYPDIVSCVQFNEDGELLATGDVGGRIVIFCRDYETEEGEYCQYTGFRSFEPKLDVLTSYEIEEEVNQIKWLKKTNSAHFLLAGNDKTVKLWRIAERETKAEGFNFASGFRDPQSITRVRVPQVVRAPVTIQPSLRRVFDNAHAYNINSVSVNSDQETYLSADDLRINVWNLQRTDECFTIVDNKPEQIDDLTEVITSCEFHPSDCSLFAYTSNTGIVRLCDMRSEALCDKHSKWFLNDHIQNYYPWPQAGRPTDIAISDVKFSGSGRYLAIRDFLCVKIWDLQMEKKPVECYPVNEYMTSKFVGLKPNKFAYDKFECCWNYDDSAIMTGTYSNFFRVIDRKLNKDCTMEASREMGKPKMILKPRKAGTVSNRQIDEAAVGTVDLSKRIQHVAWHPSENIIAVGATNDLYVVHEI